MTEKIELSSIGRLLAMTPNAELNSLATIQFSRVFGRSEVYQLATAGQAKGRAEKVSNELHGRVLFGDGVTYEALAAQLGRGAAVRKTHLTSAFDYRQFQAKNAGNVVPLFTVDETGQVSLMTTDTNATPRAGQSVVSLMSRSDAATVTPPAAVGA